VNVERLLAAVCSKEALTKQSPPNQDTNNMTTTAAQDGQQAAADPTPASDPQQYKRFIFILIYARHLCVL